jgi:hypothetical protein
MSRLTASTTARAAWDRRRVTDLAALIRGRLECFPALAHLWPKLTAAENKIGLLRYADAETALREIDAAVERHERDLSDRELASAAQHQDQLLAERGTETDRHATTGAGTRHGFMWLERKGRVTGHRRIAGNWWGLDYSLIRSDGLRSCLNDNLPGGSGQSPGDEPKVKARQRLDGATHHIQTATGSTALVGLLDAVCGRGETLRDLAGGDKIGAAVKEAELMIALDLAAVAYDIGRDRR